MSELDLVLYVYCTVRVFEYSTVVFSFFLEWDGREHRGSAHSCALLVYVARDSAGNKGEDRKKSLMHAESCVNLVQR